MERINISTKSPWEPLRAYSRAVQIGDQLYISGTTAMKPDGTIVGVGDAYRQTKYVILLVKQICAKKGFTLSDVVMTRLYVSHIGDWDKYAQAHREFFEAVRPASSIVQVSKLVDPRLMIEMEVKAIRGVTKVRSEELIYEKIEEEY